MTYQSCLSHKSLLKKKTRLKALRQDLAGSILPHLTGPSFYRLVFHIDHYGVPSISRGRERQTFLPRCFIEPLAIGDILGSTIATCVFHSVVFLRAEVTRLLHNTPLPCTSPAALPFDVRLWEESCSRCQGVKFGQNAHPRGLFNWLYTHFIARELVDLG